MVVAISFNVLVDVIPLSMISMSGGKPIILTCSIQDIRAIARDVDAIDGKNQTMVAMTVKEAIKATRDRVFLQQIVTVNKKQDVVA